MLQALQRTTMKTNKMRIKNLMSIETKSLALTLTMFSTTTSLDSSVKWFHTELLHGPHLQKNRNQKSDLLSFLAATPLALKTFC